MYPRSSYPNYLGAGNDEEQPPNQIWSTSDDYAQHQEDSKHNILPSFSRRFSNNHRYQPYQLAKASQPNSSFPGKNIFLNVPFHWYESFTDSAYKTQ